MKTKKYLFIFIILVASFLRLWKLGTIPPSLTPDEAALGYNAYSILKTARDEYGKFMPFIFKSFGDYKPGLYVYLTVPYVATFGLNEFAVRLPSAVSGVLAVYLLYLIICNIKIKDFSKAENRSLGLVSMFMLAINPWHIHFSRGAWEVNVTLTLTLAGIYFFIKSLKKPKQLIISSIFFALTFITYQGAKLSTAIVLLILTIIYWKDCRKLLKKNAVVVAWSFVIGFTIISPIILSFFGGKVGRLNIFSVFSYPRPKEYLQSFLDEGGEEVGSFPYYIYHSETLNFTRGVMGRWFNHFSGKFLFFEGDWPNPQHSSPYQGMMFLSDIVFVAFGIFSLIKSKTKLSKLIFIWLILSPLPAVLSRDQVQAVRAYNTLVPLVVISSFGIVYLIEVGKKLKPSFKFMMFSFLYFIFIASFIYFIDAYFVHLSKHNSDYFMYGYKQIVEEITPIQSKYTKIKIQQSFSQPYVYFLFYQKYDPLRYQKIADLTESEYKGDVGYIRNLDNIYFSNIDFSQDKKESGTLVVADTIRIPDSELNKENVNLINEINYLDGETAFRIVEIL